MERLKNITYKHPVWGLHNQYGTSAQVPPTRFMLMSVEDNKVETKYNILASLSSWITCAGFVTLPNTFTSLQNSSSLGGNSGGKIVQDAIRNLQLLPLTGIFCVSGILCSCYLWSIYKSNYIWLMNHIFLPGISHSLLCLMTIVVNIVTIQGGYLSVTAKLATVTVAVLCAAMICLSIIYQQLLNNIIRLHDEEVQKYQMQSVSSNATITTVKTPGI